METTADGALVVGLKLKLLVALKLKLLLLVLEQRINQDSTASLPGQHIIL